MTDTIAALATRSGAAALGIVRISGPSSGDILKRLIPGTRATANPRSVCAGRIFFPDRNTLIDEVLCFFSPGPNTSTGEDVAEIHGHGGVLVMKSLLDAVLCCGARPAHPGEFTSRAFRNGRMDLTQAEAVMALIGARSERAARVAARQLAGSIGDGLAAQYDALTGIAAALEAGLDFPDEDLPPTETARLLGDISRVRDSLNQVAASYRLGARLTDGATVVISGPANAGKSSLLNLLAREDKALVDATPGTTRDIVEARGEVDGIAVVYLDTAGFREAPGALERRGIEKTRGAMVRADLLLLVVDGTDVENTGSLDVLVSQTRCPIIIVHNKCDQQGFRRREGILSRTPDAEVDISALRGDGLPSLEKTIATALSAEGSSSDVMLTTARQHMAVSEASQALGRGQDILARGFPPELAAMDIRAARESLSELWGRHAGDDVIDRIFSSFCLGK